MKKISALILCVSVSFSVLGQKKELKIADKLMKKSADFAGAAVELAKVTDLVVDTKFQTQYYYLMGVQAFGDENKHDYLSAYKYFSKTIEEELSTGSKKFNNDTRAYIKKIKENLYNQVNASVKANDYALTGDVYKELYEMEPGRKDLLEVLINCRLQTTDYQKASVYIEEKLEKLGDVLYYATDNYSSVQASFFTKEERDYAIKIGTHKIPYEDTIKEDEIVKSYEDLVALYTQLDYADKKAALLESSVKKYPGNKIFMNHYTELVYKSGNHESYLKVLENNLKVSPNNKSIWFNIGVTATNLGDFEKASEAYEKAIELDPNYRDAYINKGLLMMKKEKEMVKELNKAQGTKKYIVVKEKIEGLYRDAALYLEKAYAIEKKDDLKGMLKQIYSAIGETAKAKAL